MKLSNPNLSARQALCLLALWLAVFSAALLGNAEIRDGLFSRLRRKSVSSRVHEIVSSRPWIGEAAATAGGRLSILVFKAERRVELRAPGWDAPRIYGMAGFSGRLGPKLREGDGQIPEGVYGIEYLNPNSAFHLSLKVSYPGERDRLRAVEDGRDGLGGDIMIHGGGATAGCIPVGDEAIEEIFCFAATVGRENTRVVIAPYDMRRGRRPDLEGSAVAWYGSLCDEIAEALAVEAP